MYENEWTSNITPNEKVDSDELRNVIKPACRWSEKRSDKKTKYKDMIVIKMAWTVEIPLQKIKYLIGKPKNKI